MYFDKTFVYWRILQSIKSLFISLIYPFYQHSTRRVVAQSVLRSGDKQREEISEREYLIHSCSNLNRYVYYYVLFLFLITFIFLFTYYKSSKLKYYEETKRTSILRVYSRSSARKRNMSRRRYSITRDKKRKN